jgi:hypothetical protein
MTTRKQEEVIARLATKYGRVHIDHGFEGTSIEVTVPDGNSWRLDEDGHILKHSYNFSIDWSWSDD